MREYYQIIYKYLGKLNVMVYIYEIRGASLYGILPPESEVISTKLIEGLP